MATRQTIIQTRGVKIKVFYIFKKVVEITYFFQRSFNNGSNYLVVFFKRAFK